MTKTLRKGTPTPIHDEMVAWTHRMLQAGEWLPEILEADSKIDASGLDEYRRVTGDWIREAEDLIAGRDPARIVRLRELKAAGAGGAVYDKALQRAEEGLPELRRRAPARLAAARARLEATEVAPPRPSCRVQAIDWEQPVENGRGVIVGYIDLVATVSVRHATFDGLASDPGWVLRDDVTQVYFDAKPEIPSVGELLRQINKYRHYIKSGVWVVVSPETRYEQLLASQDVRLIIPTPQSELALGDTA